MIRTIPASLLVLLLLAFMGCESSDSASGVRTASSQGDGVALGTSSARQAEEEEEEIPLSEVPDHVMEAATEAVPGIVFDEAEREWENDVLVYGLEGSVDGEYCEVEVSAGGEVLEIESVDDEEDDDDDDDDEGEDDD